MLKRNRDIYNQFRSAVEEAMKQHEMSIDECKNLLREYLENLDTDDSNLELERTIIRNIL